MWWSDSLQLPLSATRRTWNIEVTTRVEVLRDASDSMRLAMPHQRFRPTS